MRKSMLAGLVQLIAPALSGLAYGIGRIPEGQQSPSVERAAMATKIRAPNRIVRTKLRRSKARAKLGRGSQ